MMIDLQELRKVAKAAEMVTCIIDSRGDMAVFMNYVRPEMIIEILDRLEAAEKECDALRAKIAAMEQQVPVSWQTRTRPARNDGTWGAWRKCSEEYAEDIKKTPLLHDWLYEARALYALPGAKGE